MAEALVSAAIILVLVGAQAHGRPLSDRFNAGLALASRSVFQSVSPTDHELEFEDGFDWAHDSGVYLSLWTMDVGLEGSDDIPLQVDLYGGFRDAIADLSYDLGLVYRADFAADSLFNSRVISGKVGLGYDLSIATVNGAVFYTPRLSPLEPASVAAGLAVSLPYGLQIDANLPPQILPENSRFDRLSCRNWNAGVSYFADNYNVSVRYHEFGRWEWSAGVSAPLSGLNMSLRYEDASLSTGECGLGCDTRIILAVSPAF